MHSTPPAIPGNRADPNTEDILKKHVAFICHLENFKFPGSQPVSFGSQSIQRLLSEDYWVCEKSDGIRVLLLIVINPRDHGQEVYLIDRRNHYYEQHGLFFPHYDDPTKPLGDSLLDCELVEDVDPRTNRTTLRLLVFDALVADYQNLMTRNLSKRYGRLQEHVLKKFQEMLRNFPDMREKVPFDVIQKPMKPSYHVQAVVAEFESLQHGQDGLIFTNAETPYIAGTDSRLLKWKPASENSIDLRLRLHFPPSSRNSNDPDLSVKPRFGLYVWLGGEGYDFFDTMDVSDEEWIEMKKSGEQLDDRIVEVVWDAKTENWRILRFRDDKPNANHHTVVNSVLESIKDGVELNEIVGVASQIRSDWKTREERRKAEERRAQQQLQQRMHAPLPPRVSALGSIFKVPPRPGEGDMRARLYGPPIVYGFAR